MDKIKTSFKTLSGKLCDLCKQLTSKGFWDTFLKTKKGIVCVSLAALLVLAVLLVYIGLNMIREAVWGDDEAQDADFSMRAMFPMAVATSIDALAVGVTMAFLEVNVWVATSTIGVVTFIISVVGLYLGSTVGAKLGDKAGILGGIILIAIGVKIVIEHLFF